MKNSRKYIAYTFAVIVLLLAILFAISYVSRTQVSWIYDNGIDLSKIDSKKHIDLRKVKGNIYFESILKMYSLDEAKTIAEMVCIDNKDICQVYNLASANILINKYKNENNSLILSILEQSRKIASALNTSCDIRSEVSRIRLEIKKAELNRGSYEKILDKLKSDGGYYINIFSNECKTEIDKSYEYYVLYIFQISILMDLSSNHFGSSYIRTLDSVSNMMKLIKEDY
jgi:hypothetical protein